MTVVGRGIVEVKEGTILLVVVLLVAFVVPTVDIVFLVFLVDVVAAENSLLLQ